MPSRKIPSLNWLRVFDVAARTQSFKATANILNMTAAAVSQQISALEHFLERKLFDRTNRSVALTEFGALYYREIREPISTLQFATDAVLGIGEAEQLSIEAPTVFLSGWLIPRIPDFLRENPSLQLNIVVNEESISVGREASDVLILYETPVARSREIIPLYTEVLFPVALPEIAKRISKPEDLLNEQLIDVKGHTAPWRIVLDHLGIGPEAQQHVRMMYVTHTTISFAMASAGMGVAMAYKPSTDHLMKIHGLVACPIEINFAGAARYFLAIDGPNSRRPTVDSFKTWILSEVAKTD